MSQPLANPRTEAVRRLDAMVDAVERVDHARSGLLYLLTLDPDVHRRNRLRRLVASLGDTAEQLERLYR